MKCKYMFMFSLKELARKGLNKRQVGVEQATGHYLSRTNVGLLYWHMYAQLG